MYIYYISYESAYNTYMSISRAEGKRKYKHENKTSSLYCTTSVIIVYYTIDTHEHIRAFNMQHSI